MTPSNPWDGLKLPPLSPEQRARVAELMSQPIIEPPHDPWVREYFWPVRSTPAMDVES